MSNKCTDYIIQCKLEKNDIVIEQNDLCKEVCGVKSGQRCLKGCQPHLKNTILKPYELTLLRSRKINRSFYDITYYGTDVFAFIKLYPAKNQCISFTQLDLTKRELEIAKHMFEGYRNSEIMKLLDISKSTLKTHINHIYQKIGGEYKGLRP